MLPYLDRGTPRPPLPLSHLHRWVFVDVMKASSPWFTSYTPDT